MKGTSKMNATATVRVNLEPGGAGVVTHVRLHALGTFADRMRLGHALSERIVSRGERRPVHDRDKEITQMALVIAGGGESCADVEHLRVQRDLFGHVASDSTVFRTSHKLDGAALVESAKATTTVRATVWNLPALTNNYEPVALDIHASLVVVHSENKECRPTLQRFAWVLPHCWASPTPPARPSRQPFDRVMPPPTSSLITCAYSKKRFANCPTFSGSPADGVG